MKKPNIDLSKEGLSHFFLHHTEKVILGLAVAALVFLFWQGWKTEKYSKTEPKKLQALAANAKTHIGKSDSWTKIAEFRPADNTAHNRIEEADKRKLQTDKYAIGRILGTKAASLGLRGDPELERVEELEAFAFRAPFLLDVKSSNPDYISPISKLQLAGAKAGGGGDDDRRGEFGGGGSLDGNDDDDDKKGRDDEEKLVMGDTVPPVMQQEMVGVRPSKGGRTNQSYDALVRDVIAVKGVLNFDAQFKKHEAALKDAIGYYPLRDRPQYTYLEVQRREVGTEEWVDISERFFDRLYATDAPEVIDVAHFDRVFTRPIPPMANYDYRDLASHPKVSLRKMVPDKMATRYESNVVDAAAAEEELFEGDSNSSSIDDALDDRRSGRDRNGRGEDEEEEDEGFNSGRSGQGLDDDFEQLKGSNMAMYEAIEPWERPKAEYKLVRFFDFRATPGKTYQYRCRLWLIDPNDIKNDVAAVQVRERSDGQEKGSAVGPEDSGSSGGGGDGEKEDLSGFVHIPLDSTMQNPEVRVRLRAKLKDPGFPNTNLTGEDKEELEIYLDGGWTTPWSEPTSPVTCGSNPADFYAGKIVRSSTIKFGDFQLPRDEDQINLVTSLWDKRIHTAIPSIRQVRRSDVMNFEVETAHVLHPGDGSVRKLENAEIKTGGIVVDMMGGGQVDGNFPVPVEMPSEVLILDGSGKFRLQNSYDDLRGFRHSLFLDDEDSEYGKAKKKKKKDGEDRGGDDEGDEDF